MEIVPVIDLKGGHVVHARGGRRPDYRPISSELATSSGLVDIVAGLRRLWPFRCLYIADLDAIAGRSGHARLLADLAVAHPALALWIDCGIGEAKAAKRWLGHHNGHLVLGSESQHDNDAVQGLRRDDRVILSLDYRAGKFIGPPGIVADSTMWPERVVVMSLDRVGESGGPDLERVVEAVRRSPDKRVYAAGGVRGADDLRALHAVGATGALVATALHTGQLGRHDLAALS